MKATILLAGSAAMFIACGGGTKEAPPTTGPPVAEAPPLADDVRDTPLDPSADERGAVWGERVERAFVALTVDSLVPAPARATAVAGWRTLDGDETELPADDAALASALRKYAAEKIGGAALPPERAWEAIAAMTAVADNVHAMFVDGQRLAQFGGSIGGAPFVTPGVMVHRTPEDELVVSEVLAGSPGAAAGLLVGDVITTLNGRTPRRVVPLFDVMFGPAGEKAVLGIRRGGTDSKVTVSLESFLHPVGTNRVEKGGIGVIRLYFCGLGEAPERNHVALTRAALAEFGTKKVSRVVIDLRGNMGGGGVAQWASIFTTADPILVARAKTDAEDYPWPRNGDAWAKPMPVAVLVDEQTVSCGEMIAYALAEHGVARIFGQPTGEAFHVPDAVDLGEDHTLLIPTSVVFGPKTKTVPAGYMVTPHEAVPNRTVAELIAGKDPQLDAARRWLAKQKVPKR
jgi:C-terminal processing protease CtpA/Prc